MNTFTKLVLCFTLICICTYIESSVLEEKLATRSPSFADRCYFTKFACHCVRKPRDLKCASNGVTYRNKCAIHCYNKHCPRPIRIVHNGTCEVIEALPQIPPKPTACDTDPCICPMIFSPVCGSNGVTFSNYCTLKCAQRCDPGLRQAKSEPCRITLV